MARVRMTLDHVRAELSNGEILEGSIDVQKPRVHVEGYCDQATRVAVIDPFVPCCRAVIHEMTHRKHQRLSEARVIEETSRLMRSLRPEDVKAFCIEYQRVRRRTTKQIIVDRVD